MDSPSKKIKLSNKYNMKVTQICIGRFHHFHLARQLEKMELLETLWTGYPRFKLKDELGIPQEKIRTFPWIQAPYMMLGKLGLQYLNWLNKEWAWLAAQSLDKYVSQQINKPTILIALSQSGLNAGRKAQSEGGRYICDRASSHIQFQNQILTEEYLRWGLNFVGIDPRVIEKEEQEYKFADLITVPSEFVKKSFLQMGVDENKIIKIPYGARLDRFQKVAEPSNANFRVLWVGAVSIRKGFLDALTAFQSLKHPHKEFIVIGSVEPLVRSILQTQSLEGVHFKGNIPNQDLPFWYSSSHVFVLTSIEEGLAYVQGEALACGCPVIATTNTGAEDLFENGKEGFIVPIRSPGVILERLQEFVDTPNLRGEMGALGLERVHKLSGWDSYGDSFIKEIINKH
jgi:glycosyltransferase involved in cell wall biosynthesis